jgi:hypothetical protein
MKWGAVIGGVALAALTSLPASLPARAADMTPVPQRAATSGYIPAQFFWTGFYIGAEVGYGWGTSAFADPLIAATGSPSIPPAISCRRRSSGPHRSPGASAGRSIGC